MRKKSNPIFQYVVNPFCFNLLLPGFCVFVHIKFSIHLINYQYHERPRLMIQFYSSSEFPFENYDYFFRNEDNFVLIKA